MSSHYLHQNRIIVKLKNRKTKPFTLTGVDVACSILYKTDKQHFSKCYFTLFTSTQTSAVYFKLCPEKKFWKALKGFKARRVPPHVMMSNNGETFVATRKWLKTLSHDEQLKMFLATQSIKWSFKYTYPELLVGQVYLSTSVVLWSSPCQKW